MNKLIWPLALGFLVVVAAVGAVLVIRSASHPAAATAGDKVAAARPTTPAAPSPAPTAARTSTAPVPVPTPNATDPWAVVSAYFSDVQSHHYRRAWALIGSGAVTGQTYQQFVAGYSCTGAEHVTKLSESRGQVSFDLAAVNDCTGQIQRYTGTDTVQEGKITAADVTRTG